MEVIVLIVTAVVLLGNIHVYRCNRAILQHIKKTFDIKED